ncbi:hypothetical protein [Kineococcus sp. SYSU DK005]|uniref:hypothetical protein n=1 Tax=Kineococcus sp. SYSU DK005 TaxID=3383126 RepID=UPI003D7C7D75
MPAPAPGDEEHPAPGAPARGASVLAAGLGGAVLITVALPLLLQAVAWSVFDPGAAPRGHLVAMAVLALCAPVCTAGAVAARQRADVRVSVLLVVVPQAVLFAPVLALHLLGRGW